MGASVAMAGASGGSNICSTSRETTRGSFQSNSRKEQNTYPIGSADDHGLSLERDAKRRAYAILYLLREVKQLARRPAVIHQGQRVMQRNTHAPPAVSFCKPRVLDQPSSRD